MSGHREDVGIIIDIGGTVEDAVDILHREDGVEDADAIIRAAFGDFGCQIWGFGRNDARDIDKIEVENIVALCAARQKQMDAHGQEFELARGRQAAGRCFEIPELASSQSIIKRYHLIIIDACDGLPQVVGGFTGSDGAAAQRYHAVFEQLTDARDIVGDRRHRKWRNAKRIVTDL